MENKNGVSPVLVGFILLVVSGVAFLIYKAVGFGLDYYNDYWSKNNSAYGRDVEFYSVKAFDPEKLKPADAELEESALKLLYAHIDNKSLSECGTKISLSESQFDSIDPDNELSTPVKGWKDLCAFAVSQKGNRAIVAYDYTIVSTDTDAARQYCYDTYKTICRSRIYLEKLDGIWTVTDVMAVP